MPVRFIPLTLAQLALRVRLSREGARKPLWRPQAARSRFGRPSNLRAKTLSSDVLEQASQKEAAPNGDERENQRQPYILLQRGLQPQERKGNDLRRRVTSAGTGACCLRCPEPVEQVRHRRNVPPPAPTRQHSAAVQLLCDRSEAGCATRPDVRDHRSEVASVSIGVASNRFLERHPAPASPPEGRGPIGIAELHPAAPGDARRPLVRREIASRLACATSAMMPTVRSFASSRSTAANRTPLSRKVSRKAAFATAGRAWRSPASPGHLGEVQCCLELRSVWAAFALHLREPGDSVALR